MTSWFHVFRNWLGRKNLLRVISSLPNRTTQAVPFETAFYEWVEAFVYEWPDFLREQKSEKAKSVEATMTLLEKTFGLLNGTVSPDDRRMLCQYVMDTVNSDEMKEFLPVSLDLNLDGSFEQPALYRGEGKHF